MAAAHSHPKLACWIAGSWKFGCITKIAGAGDVPPVGAAQLGESTGAPHFVLGYVGIATPVNVSVWTLMPLLECAVPTMIDGVRP